MLDDSSNGHRPAYAEALPAYQSAGWTGVLPLPAGKKFPPPSGFTGHDGHWPTASELATWAEHEAAANLGLRLPSGVLGIDVDAYGTKQGGTTLAELEARLGPLPPTWRSSSRTDPISGIRFFRVPEGLKWPGKAGRDIETIHLGHRYVVAWPSVHPDGGTYRWFNVTGEMVTAVPTPAELPELPPAWVRFLTGEHEEAEPVSLEALGSAWLTGGDPCQSVKKALKVYKGDDSGSRHDTMRDVLLALLRLGEQGHKGAGAAVKQLADHFVADVAGDREGGEAEAREEGKRAYLGAIEVIAQAPTPISERGCCGKDKGKVANGAEQGRSLRIVRASDIVPRATRWTWESPDGSKWVALGGLTLLAGREGVGKSTIAYDVAAKLTRGELAGDFAGTPRSVVVAATEDAWAETVIPRLQACRADLDRVFRVDAVTPDGFPESVKLPDDLAELERLIRTEGVALVLLDPLMGAISGTLDSHKDHDVRHALEPLSRLAAETQVSIIGLIHENKSQSADLLNRIMASRAFSAVARGVLYAAKDNDDLLAEDDGFSSPTSGERFLFGQAKNNLAAKVPYSLRYTIEGATVGHDNDLDKPIFGSRIAWGEKVEATLQDIVTKQESRSPQKETAGDRVVEWVQAFLTRAGGSAPSKTVKEAAKKAGHAEATLKRHLKEAGVTIEPIPNSQGGASLYVYRDPTDLTDPGDPTDPTDPS